MTSSRAEDDRARYHRYRSGDAARAHLTVDEREAALVEFVRTHRPLTWAYLTGDDQ